MRPAATTRYLHVANGTSTTSTIHEAGIPGLTSIWADGLHDGPVPAGLSDDELLELRARYLSDRSESIPDVVAELRTWRAAIDRTDAYDELVLWYEHDLFDQLNLIQVLDRIRRTVGSARIVSLICIGSYPGRPRFKGLGELTPDELSSLFSTRQPLATAHYDLAERAWTAFRAPDPREIEHVVKGDTSALPFLEDALERYLEEFPSVHDGLSRTERRLLDLVSTTPADIRTIFPRMHDLETAFYIADLSFWGLIEALASLTPPLIAVDVQARLDCQLPRATIKVTEHGQAVRAGREDRIRLCGIDRWLGGVHLEGKARTWRWDDGQARIVLA
jgi:hypothetical protein